MTKEDALFFLMRFRRNGINEQLYDALGVAIEALKAQEPKPDEKDHQEHGGSAEFGLKTGETCADAISRQDAIDALNEYFARIGKLKRRGLTKGEKAISLDTVGIIKTLPSAEPTLYGYPVKHLAQIAAVMEAEEISAREAILILKDAEALVNVVIAEQQKIIKKQFSELVQSWQEELRNHE